MFQRKILAGFFDNARQAQSAEYAIKTSDGAAKTFSYSPTKALITILVTVGVLMGSYFIFAKLFLIGGIVSPLAQQISPSTVPATSSSNLQPMPTEGTSFGINDPSEFLRINVFANSSGDKYKAEIAISNGTTYDAWQLVYINPNLCFKKSTFAYMYCVNEKISGMGFARAIAGITQQENVLSEELTKEEKIASYWVPTNILATFLGRIELALVELRKGTLKNNLELKIVQEDNGGNDLGAGLINGSSVKAKGPHTEMRMGLVTDVRAESTVIEIPTDAIDLSKLAIILYDNQISAQYFTSTLNLEYSDGGDKHISELMNKYHIYLRDVAWGKNLPNSITYAELKLADKALVDCFKDVDKRGATALVDAGKKIKQCASGDFMCRMQVADVLDDIKEGRIACFRENPSDMSWVEVKNIQVTQ